jgi:hypothetical protein
MVEIGVQRRWMVKSRDQSEIGSHIRFLFVSTLEKFSEWNGRHRCHSLPIVERVRMEFLNTEILSFSKCSVRRYRVDSAELFVKICEGRWDKGILSRDTQGCVRSSMHIDYITLFQYLVHRSQSLNGYWRRNPPRPLPSQIGLVLAGRYLECSSLSCHSYHPFSVLFQADLPVTTIVVAFMISQVNPRLRPLGH